MLPLGLVFVGVLLVVRALRPSTPLPRRRLVGIGLLALAVFPSERLLGSPASMGVLGEWLSTWLLDLLGGPATLVVLVAALGVGVLLAFDIKVLRVSPPRADVPAGRQLTDAES